MTAIFNNSIYLNERIKNLNLLKKEVKSAHASTIKNRWMNQPPFQQRPEMFEERLHSEQMDAGDFDWILANLDLSTVDQDKLNLEWVKTLETALGKEQEEERKFRSKEYPQIGFLNVATPVILHFESLLKENIASIIKENPSIFPDFESVSNNLKFGLYNRYIKMILKPCILELNIFKLEEKLQGETPQDRFVNFTEQLCDPAIRDYFFQEYPVLCRQMVHTAELWLTNSTKIIHDLVADYQQISIDFFDDEPMGQVENIQTGMGDHHRGGKSVAIMEFDSGKKVVYKPRSLQFDQHFQELVSWLQSATKIPFKLMGIIDKTDHGWVEFIEHTPCNNYQEVREFYVGIGAYSALIYLMNGSDFHYENIIAHGSSPVLIDLEAFFNPRLPVTGSEPVIDDTVLNTGLMPINVSITEEEEGSDLGGITDVEGRKAFMKGHQINNMGSDEMKMTREYGTFEGGKNIPILNGEKINNQADYIDEIQKGFRLVYDAIFKNRTMLFAKGGAMHQFKNDDVRMIFRDTFIYAHLLDEANHPKILGNAIEKERVFDWLWSAVTGFALLKDIIPYEKDALLQGDIPLFTTKVDSLDLVADKGAMIKNFFTASGYELAKEKIMNLNKQDLERQLWLINASITMSDAIQSKEERVSDSPPVNFNEKTPATRTDLIKEAEKVGQFLIDNAYTNKNEANWMGFKAATMDAKKYKLASFAHDLFSGLPGEILFLTYLYEVTEKPKYRALAEKAFNTLHRRVKDNKDMIIGLGGFAGWGGILYCYAHIIKVWKRTDLIPFIESIIDSKDFDQHIKDDKILSLVNGSAGFIIACSHWHKLTHSARSKELCKQAADHLVASATQMPKGAGWIITSKVPLSGMAHGASGFAYALMTAYDMCQDEIYLNYAMKALDYEHSLFVKDQNNWQDCRAYVMNQFGEEIKCSTAWSHGAPGIGLARLFFASRPEFNSEPIHEDLETAIDTTLKNGFRDQHSLTYGSFGNLELLLNFSQKYNDVSLRNKCYQIAQGLIEEINSTGWKCGVKQDLYSPGLMSGITGIGYQCLRLAAPAEVPSILTLSFDA